MSGSANNLPVKVTLEGVEEFNRKIRELAEEMKRPVQAAEQIAPAVNRAGESFNQLERRTQQAAGAVRDLRGAMELIGAGGAAGMLGPAASAVGNLADAFGTAGAVAGRFTGLLSGVSAVAAPLAAGLTLVGGAAVALGIAYEAVARRQEEVRRGEEAYRVALEQSDRLLRSNTQSMEASWNARRAEAEASTSLAQALERENLARANEAASRASGVRARLEEAVGSGRAAPGQVAAGIERARAAELGIAATAQQIADRLADLDVRLAALRAQTFPGAGAGGGGGGGGGAGRSTDRGLSVSISEEFRRQDDAAFQAAERAAEQSRQLREREEEQYLRRIEQANERTTDSIVRYSADAFADMFRNTGGGFEALMARFRQTAIQTFARIAAEAIIRPIIAPIVSGLNLGGLFGGGAGGAGGGGIGDMLGIGSAVNSLTGGSLSNMLGLTGGSGSFLTDLGISSGLFGNGISPLAQGPLMSGQSLGSLSQAGLFGYSTIGSVLGGAGLGFGAGTLLNGLAGGNSTGGMIGSGGGALAGAILGSVFPGVGTILGGLLGGAGGGLLGGLFGPDENRPPFWHLAINSADGRLAIGDLAGKRADQQMAQTLALAEQQVAQINAALAASGLNITGSSLIGTDPADPSRPADLAAAIPRFRFSSENANINQAVGGRAFDSFEEVTSAATFVTNVYEQLIKIGEPIDAFAEALKAINAQFDAAAETARDLGLSEAELEAARTRALAAANDARANAAAAVALGPVQGLSEYVRGLRVSNDNPLSPLGRRDAAQQQFEAALAAAQGNPAAISQAISGAQALLTTSRDVNGSGTGFVADFDRVLTGLQGLASATPETLTAQIYVAEQRTATDILRAELQGVRAELVAVRAELQQGNRTPARLAA